MQTKNYMFSFKINATAAGKKNSVFCFFFFYFFKVTIALILKRQNVIQSLHYFTNF